MGSGEIIGAAGGVGEFLCRRRGRRGASPPANPYSFVRRHHAPEANFAADATRPTSDTISGMQSALSMRRWASSESLPRMIGNDISAYATAPDGASVVNSTSVISLNAVANPVDMTIPYL